MLILRIKLIMKKIYSQDEILVLVDNKPIDLDLPVDENVDYIVLTGTRKSFTIKDIMEAKLNNSIEIFNGSILNIPPGVSCIVMEKR